MVSFFTLPLAQAQDEDTVKERSFWYIAIPFTHLSDREIEFDASYSSVNRGGEIFLSSESHSPPIKFIVGRQFNNGFRGEVESFLIPYNMDVETNPNLPKEALDFFSNHFSDFIKISGSMEYKGAAFNVFRDFVNKSKWTPYMGAGIGVAEVELGTAVNILDQIRYEEKGSDIVGMFNLEFGVDYEINKRVDIFINYRSTFWEDMLIDVDSPQSNASQILDMESSEASSWAFGLRFKLKK